MVSKMLLGVIALCMIASTVSASVMLEHFEDFWADMTVDNFIIMSIYQVWGFIGPLIAGPLDVVLYYLWSEATFTQEIDGGALTVTLNFYELLGFAGIGSYEMLFKTINEAAPKIMCNAVLADANKLPYGGTVDDLLKKLEIDV